ncbi:hypothetical protein F5Y16DRAFT_406709 [Xylariaceae sp. FL0255]|nr:hypothetical protein F5Y16DRAFT_406709 [Xylariaceae sp. FL0255]
MSLRQIEPRKNLAAHSYSGGDDDRVQTDGEGPVPSGKMRAEKRKRDDDEESGDENPRPRGRRPRPSWDRALREGPSVTPSQPRFEVHSDDFNIGLEDALADRFGESKDESESLGVSSEQKKDQEIISKDNLGDEPDEDQAPKNDPGHKPNRSQTMIHKDPADLKPKCTSSVMVPVSDITGDGMSVDLLEELSVKSHGKRLRRLQADRPHALSNIHSDALFSYQYKTGGLAGVMGDGDPQGDLEEIVKRTGATLLSEVATWGHRDKRYQQEKKH